MSDEYSGDSDALPVLSDVVIPGNVTVDLPPASPTTTPNVQEAASYLLAERLNFQAAALLAEMEHRIERMVEEELARAHATAMETARLSLQSRLRTELETRMAQLIKDLLRETSHLP